ncbi:MAG TPA: cardiolipin synthase [Phycisphaerae bacterium]|nr:cardiolipin synthase [Phycisphaerae bacterium]HRR86322.1 cardiolipin synthase [Phycisphaerae bacterium]
MEPWWFWLLVAVHETTVVVAVVTVLRWRKEPRSMLAWILAVRLLPVLGILFFLVFGEPRGGWHRLRRRRRRKRLEAALAHKWGVFQQQHPASPLSITDPVVKEFARLTKRLGGHIAAPGNAVRVFNDAEETYAAIEKAIDEAQSHVHMEYYIFQPDKTGQAIRDRLIRKAREGVRCRLLLDYIGCWNLSRRFVRPMREAGVEVAYAMPVIPWHGRWRVNYRNHRKIVVVDGRIGFTGSQNIGDEYRGRLARYGPWRDTHLMIQGPCVHHLQEVFIEDWHYTTREDLVKDEYFPLPGPAGEHMVQLLPSGPGQPIRVMHHLLFAAVSAARSSVSVITPYFVPDAAMVLALQSACYRGVRVRLLIPTTTDHHFVLFAGRSFYPELMEAGVEIFEHDATMLHSKVMIIDRAFALVGSANMDERSFRLNFELTVMLYSPTVADDLYKDFETLTARSRRIRSRHFGKHSFAREMATGLARLASPLL